MASNNSPRLEINISAITTDLKKGLAEARKEIRAFNDEIKKGSKTDFKTALELERLALAREKTEAASTRTEIAKLTLAKRQNASQAKATAGSYREAQQRLTALGKSIRDAEGGFRNTTPAIQRQITEYRKLNEQLKAFDKRMGLNYRNVGNYPQLLGAINPQLGLLTGQLGGVLGAIAGLRDAYRIMSSFNNGLLNVAKTTGLAGKELDGLSQGIISLSRSLQVVGTEKLTQYATVAGQLGVKGRENILNFTEALAKLETASNITGEEGGAEIARTLTLIEGGVKNVKLFGDEIVNLGNNFAATEKEILSNAEAIAQNTAIYGFSRQQVLGYAAATKSLGLEAEVVGSAFQKTLGIFENAILSGDGLNEILKVTGGSAESLRKEFATNASGVFQQYVQGLNKIRQAGGSVAQQLTENGIKDIRNRRVIQTLASSYDTLNRALLTVKDSAGAMSDEFEQASNKLSAQVGRIKIAWENLVLSIDDGRGAVGRATAGIAGGFAEVLNSITDLVGSNSWKEFFLRIGQLRGGFVGAVSNAAGTLAGGTDNTRGGFVGFKEMQSFYKATNEEQKKMLRNQEAILKFNVQAYKNDPTVKNLETLNFNAEKLAKMRAKLAVAISKPVTNAVDGGLGGSGSGSSNDRGNDSVRNLLGATGNYYQKEIFKIETAYDDLVKKIKTSGASSADISKALGIATANKDIDILKIRFEELFDTQKKIKNLGIGTPSGIVGSQSSDLAKATAQLEASTNNLSNRPADVRNEDDKRLENRLSRVVERGLRQGVESLFNSIDELGSNFKQVFSNVFQQLAGSLTRTFGNVLATQFGNTLSKSIGDKDFAIGSLSNNVSKAIVAGAGLAGGALLSQGASRGNSAVAGAGGALSGAAAGLGIASAISKTAGPIGAAVGGIIGLIGGIFSAGARKKELQIQEEQLAEQRKQTALQERQAALAYTSSIIGQQTNAGIVTGVERDAFGNLVATIKGSDIQLALDRNKNQRG